MINKETLAQMVLASFGDTASSGPEIEATLVVEDLEEFTTNLYDLINKKQGSWEEAFFDIAGGICKAAESVAEGADMTSTVVQRVMENYGYTALYDLAREWATSFETRHAGVDWGIDLEYPDTIQDFIEEKLYEED